jgi:hypothetical protein
MVTAHASLWLLPGMPHSWKRQLRRTFEAVKRQGSKHGYNKEGIKRPKVADAKRATKLAAGPQFPQEADEIDNAMIM